VDGENARLRFTNDYTNTNTVKLINDGTIISSGTFTNDGTMVLADSLFEGDVDHNGVAEVKGGPKHVNGVWRSFDGSTMIFDFDGTTVVGAATFEVNIDVQKENMFNHKLLGV